MTLADHMYSKGIYGCQRQIEVEQCIKDPTSAAYCDVVLQPASLRMVWETYLVLAQFFAAFLMSFVLRMSLMTLPRAPDDKPEVTSGLGLFRKRKNPRPPVGRKDQAWWQFGKWALLLISLVTTVGVLRLPLLFRSLSTVKGPDYMAFKLCWEAGWAPKSFVETLAAQAPGVVYTTNPAPADIYRSDPGSLWESYQFVPGFNVTTMADQIFNGDETLRSSDADRFDRGSLDYCHKCLAIYLIVFFGAFLHAVRQGCVPCLFLCARAHARALRMNTWACARSR